MDAAFEIRDETLCVAGTLDLYAAEGLRDALLELVEQTAHPRVDLTAVESCDIACLQLLGAAVRTAAGQGTPLAIAGSGDAVPLLCRQLGTSMDELLQGGY